jgi:hypothetical protein
MEAVEAVDLLTQFQALHMEQLARLVTAVK